MSRSRIWVASQRPLLCVGGIETFVVRLRQELPEVNVLEPRRPTGSPDSGSVELNVAKHGPSSLSFTLSLWWWLIRHRRDIDRLLVNRVEHAVAPILAGLGRRTIVAVHGSSAYAPLFFSARGALLQKILERAAVSFCRELAVLMGEGPNGMPYYRATYTRASNVRSRKVIVPTLPDLAGVPTLENLSLCYVGRIEEPVKRVTALAYLSKCLSDVGVKHEIFVFGAGPDEDLLKTTVANVGAQANIILRKLNSIADLPAGLHLGVVCSRFEGMCMAALELIAAGLPVVSTDVGDMKQYAQWGPVEVVAVAPSASSQQCGEALAAHILTMWPRLPTYYQKRKASASHVMREFYDEAILSWRDALGLDPQTDQPIVADGGLSAKARPTG